MGRRLESCPSSEQPPTNNVNRFGRPAEYGVIDRVWLAHRDGSPSFGRQAMFKHSLCNSMDLSDKVRKEQSRKRIASGKISHANWAVRQYARNLKRQDNPVVEPILARGIFRQYQVHPALLDYAVRELQAAIQ